jgi:hypothetical protein|tara:strand:- start:1048 stop:1257 length:210 start_codon:yes stop_codon:yes gene_type:complete
MINKLFVVFFTLFAVINLIDFSFYGLHLRNLVGALGYLLMAYGSYKNTYLLAIVGAVLAMGSIAVKYVL